MANTTLTADIIAKEAVMILDNNLVMAKQVFRGYENEFEKKVNGYEVGETIRIRVPTDFTVRDGATASAQNVTERRINLTVNKRKGVDFKFTSQDLTLNIGELSERVIKPAMVQLANQLDADLMALYKKVPNWVGTPGQAINSFADFAKGPERLDLMAVPADGRSAILSPADHWGLLGSQTALFIQDAARGAYRNGSLGTIGGVETFMAQNVPTHTVGDWASGSTPEVDGTLNPHTLAYSSVLTTYAQTITVDGFTNSAPAPAVGDVFTIEGVYAVNPVTKASLAPVLRQFVVTAIAENSGNEVDITFTPPIITQASSTPAFATCYVSASDTDLDGHDVTVVGTSGTGYAQNMMFTRNAFALVTVPLVKPPGAVDVSRQTYKGTSVRVIPVYDGIGDESLWRLDILYGCEAVDPRQAVRVSGTS
jgi:hypothetical protein